MLSSKHIITLNKATRNSLETRDKGLNFSALNASSLHLRVYDDASFASNNDLCLQLGFIILFCNNTNKCNVLNYASRKSKRVVRSIIGGNLYVFNGAFDASLTIATALSRVFSKTIPLRMLTNSKQAFDVITRRKIPTKKVGNRYFRNSGGV